MYMYFIAMFITLFICFIIENEEVRHRGNTGQYMSGVNVEGYGNVQQGQNTYSMLNYR